MAIMGYESWSIRPTAIKKSPAENSPLKTSAAVATITMKWLI